MQWYTYRNWPATSSASKPVVLEMWKHRCNGEMKRVSGQGASGAIYAPRCFAIFNESLVMGLLMMRSGRWKHMFELVWTSFLKNVKIQGTTGLKLSRLHSCAKKDPISNLSQKFFSILKLRLLFFRFTDTLPAIGRRPRSSTNGLQNAQVEPARHDTVIQWASVGILWISRISPWRLFGTTTLPRHTSTN